MLSQFGFLYKTVIWITPTYIPGAQQKWLIGNVNTIVLIMTVRTYCNMQLTWALLHVDRSYNRRDQLEATAAN